MKSSKLTPELSAEICGLLAEGLSVEAVCGKVGLHKTTFYRWLKAGEVDEGSEITPDLAPFVELRSAVNSSLGDLEQGALNKIKAASEKTWQAAAWMLERRFPDRWSLRNRTEVTGPDGEPVVIKVEFSSTPAGKVSSDD
jgi:hypothetical protein